MDHINHHFSLMSTKYQYRSTHSPISESVTEIRINSHLAREITWQHDTREPHSYHEWPPFALTIKESSWAHHTLVLSYMWKPHRVVRGGSNTIPMSSMKYSGVSSNSVTVEDTKFAGPHKSCMRQYTTQCLLQQGTTDVIINRHRRGLPPWSSESDIRPLSSFPSSIPHFPLVAPPGLT
jgi:hypothetical protein